MDYSIALEGYTSFDFDNGCWTRRVYRRGVGPAVIVIHEMPGLTSGLLTASQPPE